MRQPIDPSRITKYLELYNDGMSIYEIAASEHCTPEWVRRILTRSPEYVARPRKHAIKVNEAKRGRGRPRKIQQGAVNVPEPVESI
jgi:transposase